MKTHLVSRQNTSLPYNAGPLLCCAAAVFLSACGGDSGDGSSGSNAPLINGSGNGEPAANVATGDLQSSAANSAAKSLNVNIGSVRSLGSDSSAIAAILNSPNRAGNFKWRYAADNFPQPLSNCRFIRTAPREDDFLPRRHRGTEGF